METKYGRGISEQFKASLENDTGLGLNRILKLVKDDVSLCLEIRGNYISIYYRGGSIMKLQEKAGRFSANFNTDYISKDAIKEQLPTILNAEEDVIKWLYAIPRLKHEMDLWFGKHPKNEREFQQLMVRENNFKGAAKGTDYFICDIEYANAEGRFDLVAAYWPSSGAERKNNNNVGLALIEMKYMDGSLTNGAGIQSHIQDMKNFFDSDGKNIELLKKEMKMVFNQKQSLGLIDNKKHIEEFSDRKPEFIFVFANHDPDSKILFDELQKIKVSDSVFPFDLKFATSNFMGYGLYRQNIFGLDEFLTLFSKQIYSKS